MSLPNVIESPYFQTKFNERLTAFTKRYQELVPAFEVPTPADPIYQVLIELTLVEVIGVEKVNLAAYAQLVKLSNDIEFIFKGKIREGESFEAYRERMRGTRDLASPAGSEAQYRALTFLYGEASVIKNGQTMTASVMDAFVQNVAGDLLIHVLINSDETELKAAVVAALTSAFKKESVKPALDAVSFIEARDTPFVISALITLSPGYTQSYRETIEKNFREKFEAQKRLGWAPTVSWIIKELHQTGVKSVILRSPVTNIPVQAERYAKIQRLDLIVEESV